MNGVNGFLSQNATLAAPQKNFDQQSENNNVQFNVNVLAQGLYQDQKAKEMDRTEHTYESEREEKVRREEEDEENPEENRGW